ncbi:MAG TPA: hypothetical protein VJ577_20900, partial [Burkholderiaceae bacterium]|nr:hypothetical protein [Burkholderiaceae bacterium]
GAYMGLLYTPCCIFKKPYAQCAYCMLFYYTPAFYCDSDELAHPRMRTARTVQDRVRAIDVTD